MTALLPLGPLACGAGELSFGSEGAGETGDGDSGDGDGDSGDGDTGETPTAACIADGQLGRALAIVDSEAELVHVFEPGGDELTLPAPLPNGVDTQAALLATSSEDFIVVASSYSIYELPDIHEGAALRLFDRHTGALSWERTFDSYRIGSTFVDDQGRVAAAVGWSSSPTPAGVVVIDGQLTELPNFGPAGPIGASDWIPGWIYNDAKETLGSGFYNPFTDELVQITSGYTPPGWRIEGGAIEYIDNESPVPRLVVAGPQGESAIELMPFAGLDSLVFTEAAAGDYRLLASHDGAPDDPPILVRLELSTGELLPIDAGLPPGLEHFDCYTQRATVDAEGRVLFELRDEGAAQIHAWQPETDEWTAVGLPMTGVDDIAINRSFGRVQEIHGSGAGMTYCWPTQWSEPPASALEGMSIQLARIDPPVSVVVDTNGYGSINVDTQEQCASWGSEGGRRIYDLDDGDELELPVSGNLIWLD